MQASLIELEAVSERIKRQNLLIDELNSEFYGLNVQELGKKINRRMFETLQKIQTEHVEKMMEFAEMIKGNTKENGLKLEQTLAEIEAERIKIKATKMKEIRKVVL
jgi:hypothetical protein